MSNTKKSFVGGAAVLAFAGLIGKVIGMFYRVWLTDLISSEGIIIRILASDIRVMGRIAKGVRVMRITGDNAVVAFTRAEHDESAEIEKVEQLSEEEAAKAEAEAALEQANEVIEEAEPEDEE